MANKTNVFCSEEEMQENFDAKMYVQAVHTPLSLKAESGIGKTHRVANENLQDFVLKGKLLRPTINHVECKYS